MVNMDVDYRVCLDEAIAFLDVAKACIDDTDSFLTGKMYPFVVNVSFSCELFIKAIMIKRSPTHSFSHGHDLEQLFNALDNEDKAAVYLKYNTKCNKPLDELLNESGKAFENWRYAFERSVSICVTGIMAFAEALHEFNKET